MAQAYPTLKAVHSYAHTKQTNESATKNFKEKKVWMDLL